MQISILLIFIGALLLPVITLYKKFDLLKNFFFVKSTSDNQNKILFSKLNFSFSFLAKLLALGLIVIKLYFSLYIIIYMITNNIWVSLILGLVFLGFLTVLLYAFWKIPERLQNLIIKIVGFTLSISLSAVLLFFCIISIILITININYNLINTKIISIILKDLSFTIISSIISYMIGKSIAKSINNLDSLWGKLYYTFFNILGNIPTIILGSLTFFITNDLFTDFYLDIPNEFTLFNKLLLSILLQGIIYSAVVARKILKKRKINFLKILFKSFFETNLLINLLFFKANNPNTPDVKNSILSENLLTILLARDENFIFFIGLIFFAIYLIYFFLVKKENEIEKHIVI